MTIFGQTFSPGAVKQIQAMVDEYPDISRRSLSRRVCELLSWCRPDGRFKDMSCRKALSHLHKTGTLQLPDAVHDFAFTRRVQDTTSLNYGTHPARTGIGPITNISTGVAGLLFHGTLAVNTDGTPLGLLAAQCWARDPADFGKKAKRHQLPIKEKESYKWLTSFKAVTAIAAACPDTTVVSMGDREADIYELFALAVQAPDAPLLLVRAMHDRKLLEEQPLMSGHLNNCPVAGVQEITVPRKGSRPARTAQLSIRHSKVELAPPAGKQGQAPITIWLVFAVEENPPEDIDQLMWVLLTTAPTDSFEDACERISWYTKRWTIEVFHKALKSGCHIENRQLCSADRLEACLAIDLVVAWRIHHLTKLGRETPDVPCTAFFEEAEWKALTAYVNKNHIPGEKPPTLREAIRMVAVLGGFLARKCDGEPGTQTLWLGLQRLADITEMWKVMAAIPERPPPSSHISGARRIKG